ncbi:outer membrane protein assembly factor BamD [Algimonas ampicilliniresistens]|uniref:Outer membrane protein assembly factor BamD n=1 Tax=Algimonas ampicilliniresistens TaxID=1298735 RepID=A0ABQ5V7P0_9PROT|nr:outer membrane protein assembly factor BamD [Algimonas ampicilliniresistens]GLQ23095.1 outer membrane protein assembly factor BamD [Algimonas ampicilliniresistens]
MTSTLAKCVLALSAVLYLTACSTLGIGGDRKEKLAYIERPAELIYNEALERLEKNRWDEAKLFFEEVERQHPFSEWARRSLLMSAYASYRAADYDDSVATAQRYIGLHPGSESATYAYYLVAISFYDQIYDVGRDQETTVNAESALQQVVRRYPESDYARDARLKLELTQDHLAGKEMTIGRFYLKQNQPLAAIIRFKNVVREYDTTSQVEEAMHRMVEAYVTLGVIGEAKKVGSVLGYNYPSSEWYADSYQLLADYGVDLDAEISKPRKRGYFDRLRERLF